MKNPTQLAIDHFKELVDPERKEEFEALQARHTGEMAALVADMDELGAMRFRNEYATAYDEEYRKSRRAAGETPMEDTPTYQLGKEMGVSHWKLLMAAIYNHQDSETVQRMQDESIEQLCASLKSDEQANFRAGYLAGKIHQIDQKQLSGETLSSAATKILVPSASIVDAVPFLAMNSGRIEFLAGNYGTGTGYLSSTNAIQLPWRAGEISFHHISSVVVATEESVKTLGGTLGWGAVGAIALGPVGLLAGLLGGGKNTQITFVVTFSDGTRLLARAVAGVFQRLQAAGF